ncbi:Phox/Bem1p [Corchorus olitorius]|uniref:Phox/Bem1p n=1 Tax=Corchorus olitorius TaxID=93759 RepID=A0A1R3KQJ9_9ROSI|nr:Phox/Bem1p [Corchorus olitorius]
MVKLVEFCGYSVTLRCQLPNGELDTLISIKSEEDLRNMIEIYEEATPAPSKIRAILAPPKSLKQISPPPSNTSSVSYSPPRSVDSNSPTKAKFYRRSSSPPLPPPRMAYPVKAYYPCHLQHNPRVLLPYSNGACWH